LNGRGEIEEYFALNRFNLARDEKWEILLPIGWTTEMTLYSKYKYGSYQFHISTSDQLIINKSKLIFETYLDEYEEMLI
jgi:hypothetical protein